MKQEIEKDRLGDGISAQVIECFRCVLVSAALCCKNPYAPTVLKSVYPLPKTIDSKYGRGITSIISLSGESYEISSRTTGNAKGNVRFKRSNSDVFLTVENDHLLVWNYPASEITFTIEGYFEDSAKVEELNRCCAMDTLSGNSESQCEPIYKAEFTLPGYLQRRLILIVAEEIVETLKIPDDRENNAKDDLTGQVPNGSR